MVKNNLYSQHYGAKVGSHEAMKVNSHQKPHPAPYLYQSWNTSSVSGGQTQRYSEGDLAAFPHCDPELSENVMACWVMEIRL